VQSTHVDRPATNHTAQVGILAIWWESDDLGTSGIEKDLLKVSHGRYNFCAENYVISAKAASHALSTRVWKFVKKLGAEDVLMIFW